METKKEASMSSKIEFRKWLAKKLIAKRNEKNLEPIDIAIVVRKMIPAYKAHEKGDSEPSIIDMIRICKFYNLTIEEFFADCPIQL
jgi:hypothetical protein